MADLSKYNPEDIRILIETGKPGNLPPDAIRYLEMLELVRSMYSKYEERDVILKTLMSPAYGMSRTAANKIIADSLNYFYANNEIKVEAWKNIYAGHMEKLALYSIALDDIETARRCYLEAAKLRGVFDEKPPELPKDFFTRPVVIYTIKPEQVGIDRANRVELAKMIDEMPELSPSDRRELKRDASVFDEFTLFEDIDETHKD